MGTFEEWAAGLLDYEEIQEAIHFRERHVAMIMSPEKLKERWEKIGYKPAKVKPEQLKLF